MKKSKIIALILVVMVAATGLIFLASCEEGKPVIGIIQFGTHESLNNCYEGIKQGLLEEGINLDEYKVEYHNSNFEPSVSGTQAASLVSKRAKVIIAIATPSAMAAQSASNGKVPVVFSAVSDPSSAGFVQGTTPNLTGTSDALDIEGQLDIIQAFYPNAKNIGIMYTTTEENALSQLSSYKAAAALRNLTIVEQGVTNQNEIPTVIDNFLNKVDVVTNLTDNNVVGQLELILQKAKANNIPVFGSEIEQVKDGALASASLDYIALGKQTGIMAAKILKGEKASNIPYFTFDESFPCYNSEVMAALGLTLPASLTEITDVK